jgi:mRNA interferase MazF
MGAFAAGQIVIVHFPFSDLTASKLRPAVVLAEAGRGDWILCQITSKDYGDRRAIKLKASDFSYGSLRVTSYARPGKLFTPTPALSLESSANWSVESSKFSATLSWR